MSDTFTHFAAQITPRLPRVAWCCTCDKRLGSAIRSEVGPINHLSEYPDHYVIEVDGPLYIWRKRTRREREI